MGYGVFDRLFVFSLPQIALMPVTPSLARRILQQLGLNETQILNASWSDCAWGGLASGQATEAPQPIFGRIETIEYVTEPAPTAAPAAAKAGAKGGAKAAKQLKVAA